MDIRPAGGHINKLQGKQRLLTSIWGLDTLERLSKLYELTLVGIHGFQSQLDALKCCCICICTAPFPLPSPSLSHWENKGYQLLFSNLFSSSLNSSPPKGKTSPIPPWPCHSFVRPPQQLGFVSYLPDFLFHHSPHHPLPLLRLSHPRECFNSEVHPCPAPIRSPTFPSQSLETMLRECTCGLPYLLASAPLIGLDMKKLLEGQKVGGSAGYW